MIEVAKLIKKNGYLVLCNVTMDNGKIVNVRGPSQFVSLKGESELNFLTRILTTAQEILHRSDTINYEDLPEDVRAQIEAEDTTSPAESEVAQLEGE